MTETVRINATLDEELLKRIDFYAERNLENRSTAIRQLISDGLKKKLQDEVVDRIREHKMTVREGAELLGVEYWEMQGILEDKNVALIDVSNAEIEERNNNRF